MKNKSSSLQDLGKIKQNLKQQRQQRSQNLKQAKIKSDAKTLFTKSVGKVRPLRADYANRVVHKTTSAATVSKTRKLDEAAVFEDDLSDSFDACFFTDKDEELSYCRAEIGIDVIKKLRKGYWDIQSQLDLHGLNCDAARKILSQFLCHCTSKHMRCVRIITGKGLSSPNKKAILRHKVPNWLAQRREVLAFVQAHPIDGGAGALLVLLCKSASDS